MRRLSLAFTLVLVVTPTLGADYVIHISVDGLRPDFLQTLINAGSTPNFKRFQDEGAWTHNARTDFTHTNTLPNHTAMVTGRPVSLPTGAPAMTHHGYTENDTPPTSETLHNFTSPDWYKASAWDVAHDAGLSTALFAAKTKFVIYDQSYNAASGADHPNGRDKIDRFFTSDQSSPPYSLVTNNQFLADMGANHYKYSFLHYADPDDAGHGSGWGGTAWNNAVIAVDGYLASVFNLVESDPVLVGKTAIVLSADHGGTGTGHSTATTAANYTIPFYAWGAGVAHGDLYALNAAVRTNPGTGRPDYNAAGQPIRNGDGGNLALTLLGLGPIPGSLINATQNLRVAAPGDYDGDGSIDGGDLANWSAGFGADAGASHFEGDSDGDRDVDGADFLFWQQRVGGPLAVALPEPGTVPLLAIGLVTLARRRSPGHDGRAI